MHLPARPVKRSSDWVMQLINIVFLLLLYFLVNGTIAGQQEFAAEPPRTLLVTAASPPNDAVVIDEGGAITFRGKQATVETLASLLASEVDVKVVADRRLQALILVGILDRLHDRGVGNISLVTVQNDAP